MAVPQRLQAKVALVTGATRGIGLAIARALAGEGCNLAITARNSGELKKVSAELRTEKVRVLTHPCDTRDAEAVNALAVAIRAEFQQVDILINNAGISHAMASVDQLPPEVWNDVIATNLTAMFLVTQATLPLMRSGGTIVNNLSVAAKEAFPGQAAYCASKFGALGFSNTLREELRPRGIRVISLIPGATSTELWDQFWPEAPRQKMLSPEMIAQVVLDALLLPPEVAAEEVIVAPTAGKLT